MNTQPKILKWSLMLGYDNFCIQTQVVTMPDNQDKCLAEGGQWTEHNYYYEKPLPATEGERQLSGYCDLQFTCRQEYQDATGGYDRNIFVVLVVLGALSVLLASFLKSNMVLSGGLSLAGVLSFIIASMRYWSAADNLVKVIILAIALGILIWIAIRKFNDRIRPENNEI